VASIVIALMAAGAVAADVTGLFRGPTASTNAGVLYHTGTATVTRQSLTSQTQVDATLGYAGSYSVVNEAQGSAGNGSGSPSAPGGAGSDTGSATITSLPDTGRVVSQGQALYAVSGSPVVLLYGNTPAYRDLSEGDSGADVTELNQDLVALGYVTAADLGPASGWGYFSAETAYGVEQLQAKLGVTQTGSLALGSAVFLPGAIEVTGYGSNVVLGGSVTTGEVVITGSSTTPVVTVDLDASLQGDVHAGEPVSITLPDGSDTPGTVSAVSNVASSSSSSSDSSSSDSGSSGSSPTITVLVSLNSPKAAGGLNQAPVEVTITTGSVSNALVVPVDALLAQANGDYAVEVIEASGQHHLVDVTPGLFDDAAGLVQVTGSGLAAGQKVVVPAT
jgi:Putative peptidoglycan binding domain